MKIDKQLMYEIIGGIAGVLIALTVGLATAYFLHQSTWNN